MNSAALPKEFLKSLYRFYKIRSNKAVNMAMHGEAFALQIIAQHNDFVVPSDIENAMSVSSARIATILSGLENKGLITRRIDTNDRRRTILRLTQKGEIHATKSEEQLLVWATELFEYLGDEDAKHCIRIISKIADKCDD